ncbi:hypothetical protein QN372_00090 [Undibacterium sp. RTI2.1]|uniref:hypothetical protein n=1 Tax=unclassified Undibacterium TaxID=2630295 RepID=UPI002AB48C83|nr:MULTISPECIES: hypothetical protein [unclassified Undibacterium]MDY7537539.1 hypothetical protein [Undibacterium sp. 5I1]MEB0029137.1 hypothetical protein [Undibacterium sp. RTI2.1]MEB0231923.1 hypothetical protein [Undibacterium sp. 10I3]
MASFSSALEALLNTPGMSTDSSKYKALLGGSRVASMLAPEKLRGVTADLAIVDDLLNYKGKNVDLEQISNELSENLNFTKTPNVSLRAPTNLTVVCPKGFSKQSHIGGEEFTITDARVGKKGKIILSLRPKDATNYSHAEVLLDDAKQQLNGVMETLETALPGFDDFIKGVKVLEVQKKEVAEVAVKMKDYQDFGSW